MYVNSQILKVPQIGIHMEICDDQQDSKGPSKNVNIFMSVQTVHFFRPPPPSPTSVQTNIFGFQNMGFTQNIYCATTKINPYFKPV